MYRFHIKPVQQANASPHVTSVYKDIKDILQIETVPLIFQYLANYERYFFFIWERMRINLSSQSFYDATEEVRQFVEQSVTYLETPSVELSEFVHTIRPAEREHIKQIITKLDQTNLKMMLIMIGVREAIKGIYHTEEKLSIAQGVSEEQSIDEVFQVNRWLADKEDTSELTKAARMLAPLFGNNSLIISDYPSFFGQIATEMERLENTEAYLVTRVGLEHLAFAYLRRFVTPLSCTYTEFRHLTQGTGYVDEILYFLKDTFPSHFPHLVLTTGVMKRALQDEKTSIVAQ